VAQNPKREIDRTFLSLNLAEERGLIHRDYLAHCLRWSHVTKFLQRSGKYRDAIVLDVGCGKEVPLAKLLYVNKMTPKSYVGVDANEFDLPEMLRGKKVPVTLWTRTDFCALRPEHVGVKILRKEDAQGPGYDDYILPDVFVCFEVLEHNTPSGILNLLKHALEVTAPDCHYFYSTPCWNGSAAENHVSEISFGALGALFEDLGYKIEGVYGTFASISDYQSELSAVTTINKYTGEVIATTDLWPVFESLRNYYDTNVLSVIFAPLFPAQSRNALWHLTRQTGDAAKQQRLFSALSSQPTPWCQHPDWRQLDAAPEEGKK